MWRLYLGVTLAVSGLFAYPLPAGVFMVGDEDGVLWKVDPASGSAEQVGEMGVVMTDIAFAPWGELYGVSYTDLYRINPTTAAIIEQVGPVGIGGDVNALEFDASGKLYVASIQSWSRGELGIVDLATRQTTVLGSIGYSSDGDLAFAPDGRLLMSSYVVSYGLVTKVTNSRLVRIDPTIATGQLGTSIGLTGFTYLHGMDFVGEELIGTTLAGELILIDTATGAGTLRAMTNPTIRAYGASYIDVPAPAPQTRFTSHLPETTGAKNLILVTHGWNPEGEDTVAWVEVMADMIRTRVDSNEWEVVAYQWTKEATTARPLANSRQQGTLDGKILAARNYDRVHLIGNSAGGDLVDAMAEQINAALYGTMIHTTFLDAYAPPWSDDYGAFSMWSDHYFNVGDLPPFPLLHKLTETVLDNSHNFNLTNLNPLPDDSYFGHHWPRTWYFETIADLSGSQQYGFPLSYEGGSWDPDRYPKGEETVLGQGQPSGSIEYLVQWTGQYLDLQTGTHAVSPTGLVQFFQDGLGMQTGSPVWLITEVEVEDEVNLLRFDLEFTSATGAEGLLVVYFDDYVLGKIDERFAPTGIQQLVFELDDPLPSLHALSLRLDSFSAVPSSASISNLEWGSVHVVPEPSTLILTVLAILALVASYLRRRLAQRLSREAWSYS
ncbi:MAG: PEP-CTERM sorting domain-containing protein [bacterium]